MIMKRKLFIIIGVTLILFCGILAVSSSQTNSTDMDGNLSIPEGYHIANQSDSFVLLESDRYHTISISAMDHDTDREVLKYSLEKSMYDFTYRTNYTKGDFDIEENWYNQEYQRGILYFCDNGEELIVINYKGPLDVDLEDSPVGVILDSLSG